MLNLLSSKAKSMETGSEGTNMDNKTRHSLSPLSAWALAFGCVIGWGSFVMPGTTFLPTAGPAGTGIAMAVGAALMLVIGFNFHFMMTIEEIREGKLDTLPDHDQTLLVYCRTGRRAEDAAAILVKEGYSNVYAIGGIFDWTGEIVSGPGGGPGDGSSFQ